MLAIMGQLAMHDATPAACGWIIGATKGLLHPDTLKQPLSSLFGASMCGICCAWGATFVDGFLPSKQFRVLFPLLAGSHILYRVYQLSKKGEKTSFPEVKGQFVSDAVAYFRVRYPHLKVIPIRHEGIRIMDLRNDRIWLDYDENNLVCIVPTIG